MVVVVVVVVVDAVVVVVVSCCGSCRHSIHPSLMDQKMVVKKVKGMQFNVGVPSGKKIPRKPACVAMTISPGWIIWGSSAVPT